ncbi:MAG: glycosyltransferase family 2 protein [Bacteroidaceae bacterium]|nr:glycosyltransferase family 2 protein [Bacteroidaceae bacterium]
MEKLLTIVIPAYNMERYLHRCLDSIIIGNVMDKVQVLVVNDGSKDRTSEIAHEYENKYPQYITVIDKENGNYGSCMNVVLSQAKGKYFRSLDADDWFETESFTKFVQELEKTDADMLIGERFEYYEDSWRKKHIAFPKDGIITGVDLPINKEYWNFALFSRLSMIWGLTYKTELIRESGLKWDEGVFYTDNEFDFWPLKLVKTMRFIPLPVYVYLLGREGQSVDPAVKLRNFRSYQVVANSMVDEFLKVRDVKSPVYEIQVMFITRMIGPFFYQMIYSNLYDKHAIKEMCVKIKNDPFLYKSISGSVRYDGMDFIDAFCNNKWKFFVIKSKCWIEQTRYKLATNKTIRRIFGKKS